MTGLGAALNGFFVGGSLIIAIGAQNAFVLRQGLLRRHVFAICLTCALADAILIILGVAGLGALISQSRSLVLVATLGGAAFLFVYGFLAFRRMISANALAAEGQETENLKTALALCLGFTLLNPHVYLDTVLLIGSISATFEGEARAAFAAGAAMASFVWFFGLGYGARLLAPIFARPAAWRILDGLIGLVMWTIAMILLAGL